MREVIYGKFSFTLIGGIRLYGALGHADFPAFGLLAMNRCTINL
jgi:hypothetical protein